MNDITPIQQLPAHDTFDGSERLPLGIGAQGIGQADLAALRAWLREGIADGQDGADGASLLHGTGAPAGALGRDGDFYFDKAAATIYGPKLAGAWPAGSAIRGETDLVTRRATLDAIIASVSRNVRQSLPPLTDKVVDVGALTDAHGIANARIYAFPATDAEALEKSPVQLIGAEYTLSAGFNGNIAPFSGYRGNGINPLANPNLVPAGRFLFATDAPVLAIKARCLQGIRLLADREYLHDGARMSYQLEGTNNGQGKYLPVAWGGSTLAAPQAADAKTRIYEIEVIETGLIEIVVPAGYTIWPGPIPSIRIGWLGDSMVNTISDATNHALALQSYGMLARQLFTGLDCRSYAIGGTGYVSDGGGTASTIEEAFFANPKVAECDALWMCGGKNDNAPITVDQIVAAVRRIVEAYFEIKPHGIVFLAGCYHSNSLDAAGKAPINAGLRALAQEDYLRDRVEFVETSGWVVGTGKVNAQTGDGNADRIRGVDGTHYSVYGQQHVPHREATEMLAAARRLRSRL